MFSKHVFITVCLVILAALLITGCLSTVPIIPITEVTISAISVTPTTMTLLAGGATGTITAIVSPSNATNKNVGWTSSNTAVATVAGGVVTPLTEGTTTITVTTVDGGLTATCDVTVALSLVAVISVTVTPPTATVVQGGTQQLTAAVVTVGGAAQTVTWTSSDVITKVTVNANGLVTVAADAAAVAYTITATSTADAGKSDTSVITVTEAYNIGDTGPSGVGIVFYITDSGLHGLEVAPEGWEDNYNNNGSYVDPTVPWITGGSTQTTRNENTLQAIGTGMANSEAIIAQLGHITSAAKLCRDYGGGEMEDWFLPSKDELNELFLQRFVVGGFAANYNYWSSSQAGNADVAFIQGGEYSAQGGAGKSVDFIWVRPVRAF